MAVQQELCLRYSLAIVAADQRLKADEASVNAHSVGPIFRHRSYSKGRNWPVRSLATSGERSGSSPSQSRHWNLRPPVLRSKNSMGLRHFGRIGGGVFLGMESSRWIRQEHYRTHSHRLLPEDGTVIGTASFGEFDLSARSRTLKIELRSVPQDTIDLMLRLFDCHRSAERGHPGSAFAVVKPDFPSPNPVFSQLDDGILHSLVFHKLLRIFARSRT
jgi:hypothetical protein